jgi:signal transduction histidine kinase
MTKEEALDLLSSDSAHERLKAARFLARNTDPADAQRLRKALQSETVSYVRTSLNLAIQRVETAASRAAAISVEEPEIPSDLRAQIKNEITEEITGQILHEIASPVGLLATSAAREIPDYESSKTRIYIENLQRVFEAIEQLKGASAVPRPQEFDLASLISNIAETVVGGQPIEISLHGTKPFIITSDHALLSFALSNGIRNAVEAVVALGANEPHSVIINWGETDIDHWVAVIDRGVGIVGPVESAFGVGKTTKRGHSGFGLAIARQAIETLGGSCTLQPAAEGGAHYEIRWEK